MKVYQTDYKGDGRFIGVVNADLDPMNSERWLIPAGCVIVEPPQVEEPGYPSWQNGTWVTIIPAAQNQDDLEDEQEPPNLKEYAAQKRWEKEVGGMNFAGFEIATDDRSKILISGAKQGADNDADFTTFFSFADGHSEVINAAQIIAISDALLEHVKAVFALYGVVMTGIISGEITTPEQVDAAFI